MFGFPISTGMIRPPGTNRPRDLFKDPGFSMGMFLAPNEKLDDVIQRDRQTLERYGVTCAQVADRLKYFEDRYLQNSNKALTAEDKQFLARHPVPSHKFKLQTLQRFPNALKLPFDNRYIMGGISTAGFQQCPFGLPGCSNGGSDYYIYDTQTQEMIEFGNLLIHMIKDHCFFEGNVEYRLDPEKAIRVLGLATGLRLPTTRLPTTKWIFHERRPYNHEDVSSYLEFLPGVYGIITGDVLELINANFQSSVIHADIVNDVYLGTVTLNPHSLTRFIIG